jgi:hypothetical protein
MTDRDTGRCDTPPYEAWFVVEVDIEHDRESPLYTSIRGPYCSKEKAEHERDEQQKAWQRALDEWDNKNPYDFKGWAIVEKHITDHQIDCLERQDEESYRITMDAVNAVGASLLADDSVE